MRTAVFAMSLIVMMVAAGVTAPAQQPATLIMIGAGGQERGGFVPRSTPYTQGTVGVYLLDQQNVRTEDGQTVTGFEYFGWTEGSGTRKVWRVFITGVPRTSQRLSKVTSCSGPSSELEHPSRRAQCVNPPVPCRAPHTIPASPLTASESPSLLPDQLTNSLEPRA